MQDVKKIKLGIILSGLGYIERGNEVSFTEMSRRFAAINDLEVFVFGAGKNFNLKGVKYIRIPCLMRHWFNHFPNIKRLHLKHNHDWESLLFSILLIPKILKTDLDVILFSAFPFTLLPLKIYKRFKNKNVKIIFNPGGGSAFVHSRFFYADKVVATDPVSTKLYGKKFDAVCIPAGVDCGLFKPKPEIELFRKNFDLPENKFIIFSASAFAKVKRLDFLIKAASKIKDVFLLFAGSGQEEDNLKKLGAKLMGLNIKFLGILNHKELVNYYNLSDVYCLPSKEEPFGLVLLEAMACGKPVVTNNTDIQKWMLAHGGSCIDMSDMQTLASELEKYKNKDFRKNIGFLALENVLKRFSWEVTTKKYYELFKEIFII